MPTFTDSIREALNLFSLRALKQGSQYTGPALGDLIQTAISSPPDGFFLGTADPSVTAPDVGVDPGSIYLRNTPGVNGGEIWIKSGDADLAWDKVISTTGVGLSHGSIEDLGVDDHSQYLLASGTRALTGAMSIGSNKLTDLANPTLQFDAATKDYVDNEISVVSGGYGPGVQTVVVLRAVDTTALPDKQIRLIEDKGALYRFDVTGVGADDGDLTLIPDTGPGRWFKTQAATQDHGALFGLGDNDHDQYLLRSGANVMTGDFDLANNEALQFRIENLAANPAFGNIGRVIFNTTDGRLKADTGSAWVDVGLTDHGLLAGLGDNDHPQYRDGSLAYTANLDMGGFGLINVKTYTSNEADGASAEAHVFDTVALSTAGAKIIVVNNNTSEIFSIDKDGNISLVGTVDGRDIDADGTNQDNHIADATIHFTEASIDHGSIGGLSDNDHPQYRDGSLAYTANLDMGSFAITNVGNVDGRDVSADGSKLDTIESNAKDDQSAAEVSYDNTSSGLTAAQVQAALDEIDSDLDTVESSLTGHLNGTASRHDATEIDYERVDGSKKNIDAASDDVEAAVTDLDDAIGALAATPTYYTPADPTITADHLAGIDAVLANVGPFFIVRPADGKAGIDAAIIAADAAGGGTVYLKAGTYSFGSAGLSYVGINNVTIQGEVDATIIDFNTVGLFAFSLTANSVAPNRPLSGYSAGASSVFTATPSHATNVLAGDHILLTGTESATSQSDVEYNIASGPGNGTTGEIPLKFLTSFTMTSPRVLAYRNNTGITFKDLKFFESGGTSTYAILSTNGDGLRVENVTFEGTGTSTMSVACVSVSNQANTLVERCKFLDVSISTGVRFVGSAQSRVNLCTFRRMNPTGGANDSAVLTTGITSDIEISKNIFQDCGAYGVFVDQSFSARIHILNNYFFRTVFDGISIEARDSVIRGNIFHDSKRYGIRLTTSATRLLIAGNKLINTTSAAIFCQTGAEDLLINDNTIFSSGTAPAFWLVGVSGTVDGNTIRGGSSDGIAVSGCDKLTVSNNTIDTVTGNGIFLSDGSINCVISGNSIANANGIGISLDSNTNGKTSLNVVSNNTITRATAAGNGILVDGGDDNVVTQNIIRGYSTNAILIQDSSVPQVADYNMVRLNNVRGLIITDSSTGINNDIANNIT